MEDYNTRLMIGSTKILQLTEHEIWWSIFEFPTWCKKGFYSKRFYNWLKYVVFYKNLLNEANQAGPLINDPLKDNFVDHATAARLLNEFDISKINGTGIAIKRFLRGKEIWICDVAIYNGILDQGLIAIDGDEINQVANMTEEMYEKYLDDMVLIKSTLTT